MRAAAIAAVVIQHTCPAIEWQIVLRPLVNFSVALFLFLSGYLTKIHNDHWLQFYKKRIIRVLIPYLVWSVFYTLSNKEPEQIVLNLVTAQAAGMLYFIFVYIQFVLLTPFLGKLAKSKYRHAGWLIAPTSILCFKYIPLLLGIEMNETIAVAWTNSCLGWLSFYYLGLLLGNNVIRFKCSMGKIYCMYFVSLLFQIGEGYLFYCFGDSNCGTQLKLTALLTSIIFCLLAYIFINDSQSNSITNCRLGIFLIHLGDCSFGIYLSHMMVLKVLNKIFPVYSSLPYVINSIVVLLLTYGCILLGRKICGDKMNQWIGLV